MDHIRHIRFEGILHSPVLVFKNRIDNSLLVPVPAFLILSNRPHPRHNHTGVKGFENIISSPETKRILGHALLTYRRHNDKLRSQSRSSLFHALHHAESVHLRHDQIQQNDIRTQCRYLVKCLLSVRCCSDHLHIRFTLQCFLQDRHDPLVIIHD